MMVPFNTDLMKYPSAAHTAATAHEREVIRARREARRAAFAAFVREVFAQPPRHPVSTMADRAKPT
ncbi:hypothetical protein OEW28_08595 [Defluviimonas sp. WL0002]|uniref:Uncharacterized protein n=1 Tax=Albidovulum marisflavi TaxID=2984159 RepID=A0ABT2ZC23_9RHOB|nr:hypothetical protein [Defluviimonas sp. WL0002]MCV2868685.1 hypothetical protein [Defluviimonas sp. WL0002]